MTSVELALAHIGVVLVYQNGPRWLIPMFRPFNCPFCLSWWIGVLHWAFRPSESTLVAAFLTPLACLLLAGFAPWIFPDFQDKPPQ